MKKLRSFLIALVLCIGVVSLTACGKVKEPTVADVEKVLKDCGYLKDDSKDKKDKDDEADSGELILAGVSTDVTVLEKKDKDEDEEDAKDDAKEEEEESEDKDDSKSDDAKDEAKGYSYEITIDKCKLNDDKNQAKVEATLSEKDGPVEKKTEFEIKFKLKDDKKTWKAKEKDVEAGEPETKLVSGISDKEAEKLIKDYYSVYVGDTYIETEDFSKLEKTDSKLDEEGMKDDVKYSVEASTKRYDLSFDIEVSFRYFMGYGGESGYWSIYNLEADSSSVKKEVSEAFKFEPDEAALTEFIKNYGLYLYVVGTSYNTNDTNVEISNVKLDKADPGDSTYVYVPCTFDVVIDKRITVGYKCEVEYYYDDTKGWNPDYLSGSEVVDVKGDWAGTWEGTMNKSYDQKPTSIDKVTIVIDDTLDADGYPTATVTIVDHDTKKGTYSWKAKLSQYGINDGSDYMYISFVEWIKKNAEVGEYDYTSISGTVTNGTFTGDWNGEVLTKKDAVASPDSATAK